MRLVPGQASYERTLSRWEIVQTGQVHLIRMFPAALSIPKLPAP